MIDKHTNLATALLGAIKARQLDAFYSLEEDCLGNKADAGAVVQQLQVGVRDKRPCGVGARCVPSGWMRAALHACFLVWKHAACLQSACMHACMLLATCTLEQSLSPGACGTLKLIVPPPVRSRHQQAPVGTPADKLRLALVWLLTCESGAQACWVGRCRGGWACAPAGLGSTGSACLPAGLQIGQGRWHVTEGFVPPGRLPRQPPPCVPCSPLPPPDPPPPPLLTPPLLPACLQSPPRASASRWRRCCRAAAPTWRPGGMSSACAA